MNNRNYLMIFTYIKLLFILEWLQMFERITTKHHQFSICTQFFRYELGMFFELNCQHLI